LSGLNGIEVTFLGTGTSQGVPVIACDCTVCQSHDPKDKRLRSSVLVKAHGKNICIDAGPDFRQQMLRHGVTHLDAIVFTHEHKDHIAGLDDVRAFNYQTQRPMDIYATESVQLALKREFHYAFAEKKYPGVPQFNLRTIDKNPFEIGSLPLIPIEVMHYRMPVLGYRIGDFAYITDANYVSEEEIQKLQGVKVLVANALRKQKHISHFTLAEAIDFSTKIKPETTYLTHISHLMGKHDDVSQELPENVFLAYDGLMIRID
jgi:phosphoribosyl 1,2-cyclic phosphate phosphodiesterase